MKRFKQTFLSGVLCFCLAFFFALQGYPKDPSLVSQLLIFLSVICGVLFFTSSSISHSSGE